MSASETAPTTPVNGSRQRRRYLLSAIFGAVLALSLVGCGGSDDGAAGPDSPGSEESGIRVVSAEEGAAIQADPPEGLVVLDVRTPEEFAEGHLDGAVMIDFYADDFGEQIAELDPSVPYLIYCRSGNRSGQTRAMMEDLGFSEVSDVDGGIQAWSAAGLPVVP